MCVFMGVDDMCCVCVRFGNVALCRPHADYIDFGPTAMAESYIGIVCLYDAWMGCGSQILYDTITDQLSYTDLNSLI